MCRKSKLRVYRELKEDFEFRFRSGTYGLNEKLDRHIVLEIAVKVVFCVSASL